MRKPTLDSNDFHGDYMESKEPDTTRLILLNTNNVGKVEKATQMWGAIMDAEADIACITETGLDTTQHEKVNRHLNNTRRDWINMQGTTANSYRSKFEMSLSSSPYGRTNIAKPGGTMTSIAGPLTGRISPMTPNDPAGRWSTVSLNRGDSTTLTIITAYQPCYKPTSGEFTAWHQQEQYFRDQELEIIEPRKRFHIDLKEMIRQRIEVGEEIILAGDFNETLEEVNSGIADIADFNNLTDIYLAHHELDDEVTDTFGTFIKSKNRRIDLVLATEAIAATVLGCGYLPYQSHMDTDHRMMYIDFDTSILLGHLQPSNHDGKRFIDSKNLKNLTNYLTAILKYGKEHKLLHRLEWMVDKPDTFAEKKLERCDNDLIRSFKHGENKCQKQYPQEFSFAMKQAMFKASFYRTCICLRRNNRDVTAKLLFTNNKLDTPIIAPATTAAAQQKLQETRTEIVKLRRSHSELRIKMLNDQMLALDYAITGKTDDEATRLKGLKRATEKRASYAKFKRARSTGNTGLNQLDVPADEEAWQIFNETPKQCTNWKTLSTANDIAAALTARNQRHFGKAHGTPFTVPPLSDDLGFCGTGEGADAIFEGTYPTEQLTDSTGLLIRHLKRDPQIAPLSGLITRQEFTSKLRTWKEKTSTSNRSGMHLGHYKSLVAKHAYSRVDPEKGDPKDIAMKELLDEAQDYFIRVHVAILNLALTHQYALTRWKEIINIMLRKDTDNRHLHRIRVIHIYEADYNLLLGVKWRSAVHQANDKGRINPGQCGGGVSGGMTSDPVVMEELHHEISRLTRKPQGIGIDDAEDCFDRIIMALAAASSRKFGVNEDVIIVTAKTLEEAIFRIKTDLGISEVHYSHCEAMPIYGAGQGSQNGPAHWLFISSILFDCHATRAHGATFTTADGTMTVTIYLIGFVDDTNKTVNDFLAENPTAAEIMERLRHDTQSWCDLLWASGGKLSIAKCAYYLVMWSFTMNGAPVLLPGNQGTQLTITDPTSGSQVKVQRLRTGEAHKILGHFREPAGNEKKHLQHLRGKCLQHKKELRSMSVSRAEAACHYFQRHIPSVTYPLGVSFLSDAKLDQLQQICGQHYINRLGFHKTTAKAIMYGPEMFGGRGLREYKTEQGVTQILNFLRHWRHNSQFGDTLRIAVSWLQFSVGTSISVFDDTLTPLPHMEGKLLPCMRKNLQRLGCHLELDNDYVVPAQRANDQWIMDRVTTSTQFTPRQTTWINYCRLYLRVTTLSDIVQANGTRIDPLIEKGNRNNNSCFPKQYKINQARPGPQAWTQWRKALRLFSNRKGILSGQPLGRWLLPADKLRNHWHAYWDPHTDSLFVRNTRGYYEQFEWHPSQKYYAWTTTDYSHYRAERSHPVQAKFNGTGWIITHHNDREPLPKTPRFTDFTSFLKGTQGWEEDLFAFVETYVQPDEMWEVLFESQFTMGCSDGSVKGANASFGWILADGKKLFAKVAGRVCALEPTSFRAEAYGILSFLYFAWKLCKWLDRPAKIRAQLHTDSKSVIQRIQKFREYQHSSSNATLHTDWDVINEIYIVSNKLGFSDPLWVEGHQDDEKPYEELSRPAQLNCQADELADQFLENHIGEPDRYAGLANRLPHNTAQLIRWDGVEQFTVTRSFSKYLRIYATMPALAKYMMNRFDWNNETFDTINWEAHAIMIQRLKSHQVTLIKMLHKKTPTNKRVHVYDPLRSPICPYCQEVETEDHMLQCAHECKKKWRNETIQTLRHVCEKLDTHLELQEGLLEGINCWLQGKPMNLNNFPEGLCDILDQQSEIGWEHTFRGRFASRWSTVQNTYYKRKGAKPTGDKWLATIGVTLFRCWFKMWDTRCKCIHGIDEKAKIEKQRARAIGEFRMLCNAKTAVPFLQRTIFPDITDMLKAPTTKILDWISLHGPMIRKYVIAKARRQGTATRAIWDHFQQMNLTFAPIDNLAEQDTPLLPANSQDSEASIPTVLFSPDQSEQPPTSDDDSSTTATVIPLDSETSSGEDEDESRILTVQMWTEDEDSATES